MVSEIGQDTEVNTSARDGFNMRSESFAGGVHCISAHRVTNIINEMNDQKWSNGRFANHTDFEVVCAAAKFLEDGVHRVRFGEEFFFMLQNGELRQMDIGQIQYLHL